MSGHDRLYVPCCLVMLQLLAWACLAAAERLPDGGFEGGPEAAAAAGWTLSEGTTVERGAAAEGEWLLRCGCVDPVAPSQAVSRAISVEPRAGYVARCRVRVEGPAHFTFGVMRGGDEYLACVDTYGCERESWDEITLPFRTGSDDNVLSVVCSRRYGAGAVLFDDVRLERDDSVRIGDVSPAPNPMPSLTDADRERGFIVSRQHWMAPIYPTYLPTRGEVVTDPTVGLAPGEYEPLAVSITATRPLHGLRAEVTGDPIGPAGAIMPREQVSVGVVRTVKRWLTNSAPLQPGQRYERRPALIFPSTPVDVRPRETQRLWLTVHAPADARPGVYRTSLRIADARGEMTLPLRVEVLPITLPEPRATYGMYYRHTDQFPELRTDAFLVRTLRDMRAHGCNSFSVYADVERKLPDGTWEIALNQENRRVGLERQMQLLAETGLAVRDHPLLLLATGVSDGTFYNGSRLVSTIQQRGREQGWPPLLWYLVDEPSPSAEATVAELSQVVHSVEGARTVTAIGDPTVLGRYYDVWIASESLRDFDPVVQQAQALGAEVWTYNCVWGGIGQPRNDRYFTGLFTWAHGLMGNWQWCYCESDSGRIRADGQLDLVEPTYGNPWRYSYVAPGVEFTVPTVGWEARREGIDDFRYLQALEKAIAAHTEDASPALLAEAQRFLDDVRTRGRRPVTELPVSQVERVYGYLAHPGLAAQDYDDIRSRAAELTVALGEA